MERAGHGELLILLGLTLALGGAEVFNLYAEAGTGFAAHVCEQVSSELRLVK